MQSLQNIHVLQQFVVEREACLRRPPRFASHILPGRGMRSWVGRRLVGLGTWVAAEPVTEAAWAR